MPATSTDTEKLATAIETLKRELAAPPSLDDELRALATFASIALALLALFTNRRTDRLKDNRKAGLKRWSAGGRRAATADVVLALVTVAALATMTPVFVDSFSLCDWFDRDHALASMFSIVYVGFAGVLVWQLSNVWTRYRA